MLDIEPLLSPVSDDAPAGENTEYTGLAELERLSQGDPGKLDPQTGDMVGAVPPEWRKVRAAALELAGQTRDLRVAIVLTRAQLELDGLAGLGSGLVLVQQLLERLWETLYPQLDPDEDNDPIERLNALANLDDPDAMGQALRRAAVVESRQAGRFTVRDLALASGRLPPREGEETPSLQLLQAAWVSGDAERHAAWRQGVEQGLQALSGIEKVMHERAGQLPRLDGLKKTLRQVQEFYAAQDVHDETADAVDAAQDAAAEAQGSGQGPAPGAAAARAGALATRADAVRLLEQVAEFVRRIEPSSPAPMFIDRAVRVMQMSFADIVKELMPDSKERIELLGGISLDPPSDDDGGY